MKLLWFILGDPNSPVYPVVAFSTGAWSLAWLTCCYEQAWLEGPGHWSRSIGGRPPPAPVPLFSACFLARLVWADFLCYVPLLSLHGHKPAKDYTGQSKQVSSHLNSGCWESQCQGQWKGTAKFIAIHIYIKWIGSFPIMIQFNSSST